MKSKKSWGQIISVGALAAVFTSFSQLPTARGELVYEPEVSPSAPTDVRADDRTQMRTALQSSEKAKATVQAVQPAQQVQAYRPVQQLQVQPVQPMTQMVQPYQTVAQQAPAPVAGQPIQVYSVTTPADAQASAPIQAVSATDAPQTDVQSLSKTELMRRERTRTELQNEDLLQERLEELRLRDEKRRTDQLLGQEPGNQQAGEAVVAPIPGLATQTVAAPVTEHPGQPVQQPTNVAQLQGPDAAAYGAYTPAAQGQIMGGQSVTVVAPDHNPNDDKVKFSITPFAGVSMMNVNSAFNVNGKYAAGLGIGMGVSDNITFRFGYTYAQYGIGLGAANAYTQAFTGSSDTFDLNQNVFDAGVKLSLLGPDSRFRPFIGGGAAYAKGYLNYPSAVTQYYQQYGISNPDFESSDFLGYLSVGFDAQVSKQVSVGLEAKYYKVLSDSENQDIAYGSFYGPSSYNPTQALAGTQLAQSSFYSLLGNVTFAF